MNNHSALNYSLWLLGKRDRSIGEMREKLKRKQYLEEEIEEAIKFLCDKNFLSDERFAKNYVRSQLSIKPLGEFQLKAKLKNKFIRDDIIESTLKELKPSENQLAEEAFSRWLRVNGSKDGKYEKVSRHLLGRGFGWEIVKEVLEKNKSELK